MDDAPELLVRWAYERPPHEEAAGKAPRLLQPAVPEATVMLAPARHGWELPAILGWGGDPPMPTPDQHAAMFHRWQEHFAAEPFAIGPNFVEFIVNRPPLIMADAEALAWDQYLYAPLVLNSRTPSLSALATDLCGRGMWTLFWDTDAVTHPAEPGAGVIQVSPPDTGRAAGSTEPQERPAQSSGQESVRATGSDTDAEAKPKPTDEVKADDAKPDAVPEQATKPRQAEGLKRAGDSESAQESRRAEDSKQAEEPDASSDAYVKRSKEPKDDVDGNGSALAIQTGVGGSSRYLGKIEDTGFWSMVRQLPTSLRIGLTLGWQSDRVGVVLIVLVQFMGGIAQGVQLLFMSRVIMAALSMGQAGTGVRTLAVPVAVLAGAYAFSSLTDALVVLLKSRVGPRVGITAKEQLLKATTNVKMVALEDSSFADDLHAANRGADGATGLFDAVVTMIGGVGRVAAALAVLGLMNAMLIPLMLISVIPKAVAAVRMARISYMHYSNTIQQTRRSRVLFGYLTSERSAAEVRTFNLAGYLLDQWREVMKVDARDRAGVEKTRAKTGLTADILTGIVNVFVFGSVLFALASGKMSVSSAGVGMLGIMILRSQTTSLVLQVSGLYEKGLYAREFRSWLSSAKDRMPKTGSRPAPPMVQEIRMQDVSFSYPGAAKPALTDVSMRLRRGETIALVGENGSGKTTLSKVLAGLYEPVRGRVIWDGMDAAEIDRESLWQQVALIPQYFTQWPFTAELNIGVGNLDRYDRSGPGSVVDVARKTGAHRLINGLRDGYDTVLGKDFTGSDLSGGQWQRLAITRAVYRDASVMIADEPSASLDARAESELFELLQSLKEDRILMLITHRLSSVRTADRIFVLKHGAVVQQGTHEELMAEPGLYKELYSLQAESFGVNMDDSAAGGDEPATRGHTAATAAPLAPIPVIDTEATEITSRFLPAITANGSYPAAQPADADGDVKSTAAYQTVVPVPGSVAGGSSNGRTYRSSTDGHPGSG